MLSVFVVLRVFVVNLKSVKSVKSASEIMAFRCAVRALWFF